MNAFIHCKNRRANGEFDSFLTVTGECKIEQLPWQKQGLQFTASGYGSRIPTEYMVKFNGKWRRVYCRIYSNIGTLYIGRLSDETVKIINIESE